MNTFLIYFIVLSPTVGLFLAAMITVSMKGLCRFFWTVIIAIMIGTIFAGGFTLGAVEEERIWNDGYCNCGGEWEFRNAARSRNVTRYYWECNSCKSIIETTYNFR